MKPLFSTTERGNNPVDMNLTNAIVADLCVGCDLTYFLFFTKCVICPLFGDPAESNAESLILFKIKG